MKKFSPQTILLSHTTELFLCILISALLFSTVSLCLPTESDMSLYDNLIRLHVIAASDSEFDQRMKLAVRDAVITCGESLRTDIPVFSKSDAESLFQNQKDRLKSAAESAVADYLAAYGITDTSGYGIEISLGQEQYPKKEYEKFTLPAGEYTSLRIVIGDGMGQNWWCVLFPPLCLEYSGALGAIRECKDNSAYEKFIAAGFTPEQYKIITESEKTTYAVKFKLIELLANLIGFEY